MKLQSLKRKACHIEKATVPEIVYRKETVLVMVHHLLNDDVFELVLRFCSRRSLARVSLASKSFVAVVINHYRQSPVQDENHLDRFFEIPTVLRPMQRHLFVRRLRASRTSLTIANFARPYLFDRGTYENVPFYSEQPPLGPTFHDNEGPVPQPIAEGAVPQTCVCVHDSTPHRNNRKCHGWGWTYLDPEDHLTTINFVVQNPDGTLSCSCGDCDANALWNGYDCKHCLKVHMASGKILDEFLPNNND